MHTSTRMIAAALVCSALPLPALAQQQTSNVDYQGFVELAEEVSGFRAGRLIGWEDFWARAGEDNSILLDTRSAEAFAAGHLAGAVNLPFSEFTEEKLAEVIGDASRPVLIYCNNNFDDDVPPIRLKLVELALNIPTFINLYGYGYRNVWELGEIVSLGDVEWVTE